MVSSLGHSGTRGTRCLEVMEVQVQVLAEWIATKMELELDATTATGPGPASSHKGGRAGGAWRVALMNEMTGSCQIAARFLFPDSC